MDLFKRTPYVFAAKTRSTRRVGQWFKWLSPGLFVKRWLFLSATGVLLTGLGIAIWTKMTPVFYIIQFLETFLGQVAQRVPNFISGPIVLLCGLLFAFVGYTRTLHSVREAVAPGDEHLVDVLLAHRRLHRGPKIVAIGGGTGLSTLLRGLKAYSANITAIVTVADDGGSSGRLRREIGVLPPGDIRNCLAALSDEETLLAELFQYRFKAGNGLSGHSFGNLFLSAMSEVTGDLERAIAACSKVLAVRGQVLPATLEDVTLWAELEDGRRVEGESNITHAGGKIARLGCTPSDPPALPRAIAAIEDADLIVIGPGSLYTSVVPNLLVPDIARALLRRQGLCVYVCNIMTERGETDGYTVSDHLRAIDRACGDRPACDAVLVEKRTPSARSLIRYAQQKCHPVDCDRDVVERLGRKLILANVMGEDEGGMVRHNSPRLARAIVSWYSRRVRELAKN